MAPVAPRGVTVTSWSRLGQRADWSVYFAMNEKVYREFEQEGLAIFSARCPSP